MTTGRINQVAKPTSTVFMRISPQATVPFLGWFREFSLSNSGIECKALTLLQFGGNSVFIVGLGLTLCTTLNLLRVQYLQGEVTKSSRSTGVYRHFPTLASCTRTHIPPSRPFRFLSRIPFSMSERGKSLYRVSA